MSGQEIQVASPVVVNGLEYNEQETAPSRLQIRKLGAYLYPQQAQNVVLSYGNTNSTIVQFMVGSQYFLDTKSSYLLLNAQITGQDSTSGNTVFLNPYTESWIQEITILTAGGVEIEKITNSDVLGSIMRRNIEMEYALSIGKEALNLFDSTNSGDVTILADRSALNYRYVIEMRLSKFLHSCYNYLPLRLMSQGNSNSFQIQIIFNNFNNMCTAYTTTQGTAYTNPNNLICTLSNIVYNQALVKDSEKEEQLMNIVKENPVVISFETHRHFFKQIPAMSSATLSVNITEYQESVLGIDSVFRISDNIGNASYDSTAFINPRIVSEIVQVQPDYYPLQQINCPEAVANVPNVSELFYQYILKNNKQKVYYKGVTAGTFSAIGGHNVNSSDYSNFILSTPLSVFPNDAVGPEEYIQYSAGLNLKKNPNPIVINMTLATSPAVALSMDTFSTFIKSLIIQSNNIQIIS